MSQSKRNAQTAFDEDVENDKSKSKRARRRDRRSKTSKSADVQASEKPANAPGTMDTKAVAISSKMESKPLRLEDRITSPPAKSITADQKEADTAVLPTTPKRQKKNRKQQEEQQKSRTQTANKSTHTSFVVKKEKVGTKFWNVSAPSGGIFLDHDPIVSADGQYLILPTKDQVRIYSVTTSLLVRSITLREKDTITSCSVSLATPNALLVLTGRGVLMKYDLSTTNKIDQWKLGSGIKYIKTVAVTDTSAEKILAIRSARDEDDKLVHFSLIKNNQWTCFQSICHKDLKGVIAAPRGGSFIILCGSRSIHIGTRIPEPGSPYTWSELVVPGLITSFDASVGQGSKPSEKKAEPIHVVVGLEDGAILVYEDILSRSVKAIKAGQKLDLTARKLHWHRNRVRSVKWSKDGNYLISGGDETTLVIWQLETNQQQFLPHLSTSILNITISNSGAQYALRLGDNSVMILSTADLAPMTNVVGLSILAHRTDRLPMQLHPAHPNRLLAAVSIRPASRDSAAAATHLQIYDIDANLQLSRQALTRNVTTAINVSPEGQLLEEPSVIFLHTSPDGYWLATIDRWAPNSSDTQGLYLKEDDQVAKERSTETTLRFWLWSAEENTWELITRVDEPHTASKYSVLGLASNPATPEFATLGEDGSIKVWQPRRRVRNGVQVRNKAGLPLFTWTCARSIQVEKSYSVTQPFASLAYSGDGSVITASWSWKNRHVHIIDPVTSTLCMSLPDLLVEGPASLAIAGRFLLCLSNTLRIFDMITLQITFTMDLVPNTGSWVAVNTSSNTFAVGLNPQDRANPTVVSIFDIDTPEKGSLNDFEIPVQIRALLAEPSTGGFVLIDSDGKIRKLTPPGIMSTSSAALTLSPDIVEFDTGKTLEDVFGRESDASDHRNRHQKLIENGETSRSLVDLISVPSTSSQPGVGELFDRISRAIASAQMRVDA